MTMDQFSAGQLFLYDTLIEREGLKPEAAERIVVDITDKGDYDVMWDTYITPMLDRIKSAYVKPQDYASFD